jgi:hypothetical protein
MFVIEANANNVRLCIEEWTKWASDKADLEKSARDLTNLMYYGTQVDFQYKNIKKIRKENERITSRCWLECGVRKAGFEFLSVLKTLFMFLVCFLYYVLRLVALFNASKYYALYQ